MEYFWLYYKKLKFFEQKNRFTGDFDEKNYNQKYGKNSLNIKAPTSFGP